MVAWLASWENWPFVLALLVGCGLVAVSAVGGAGEHDGAHDLGHDGDAHADHPGFGSALGWLGLGKAPVSVLLQVLLLAFGSVGLLVNALARDLAGIGAAAFPVALLAALAAAGSAVRAAASFVARLAPPDGQTARRPGEFVGQIGVTATLVTTHIGQVRVEIDGDTPPALLNAAAETGEIPRGAEVLLTAYDGERGLYRVSRAPLRELAQRVAEH